MSSAADPTFWDEALKVVPPVVQAISIAITAFFAVKSLRAWRVQLVGKRQFEVAEQVIVAIYSARDALIHTRQPFYMSEETKGRQRPPGEIEEQASRRDWVHV